VTCDDSFWAAVAGLDADRRWCRRVRRRIRRAEWTDTALRWGLACRALSPMGLGGYEIPAIVRAEDDESRRR
jgi:hypothetical protein